MNSDYTWEKEYFKNTYYLYNQGSHVGDLIQSTFNRQAKAELKRKQIHFNTRGIFLVKTKISDRDGNVFGQINYNLFNSTAKIKMVDKTFDLRNYNFWNSKWELTDYNGTLIKFNGSSEKGVIEASKHDENLILSGLYVANVFWHSRIAMGIVVMASIWINFILAIQ
ncbi:hypothetical protein ACE01N_05420 [Saccharicrinis sp. FJH2]|uniref:hypothetical protein n=1 Tax=Saccharicrinis sp. FJH65 TaxID=3344659 RepID=UPI0035F28672